MPGSIASVSNPKVRHARSLHRRRVRHRERSFLAEGFRLIEEALREEVRPTAFFFTREAAEVDRGRALLAMAEEMGVTPMLVEPEAMASMADTSTPQGVLAVFPFIEAETPAGATLLLIADQIRDPGNLGTLMRSADAAGADGMLMTRGTADAYGPKTVRAGMGSHFRLPFRLGLGWEEIRRAVAGMSVALADAKGMAEYQELPWGEPWAIIVGGEAEGASSEAHRLADRRIRIPCEEGVESLNAAVAGSVILFEARRQRRLEG